MDEDAPRPDGEVSGPPLAPPQPPAPPQRPARRALRPPDLDALDFILDVFLPEAHARGLAVPTLGEVRPLLDDLAAEARSAVAPGPYPAWTAPPTSPRPGPRTSLPPASFPPASVRPASARPASFPPGPPSSRPPVPPPAPWSAPNGAHDPWAPRQTPTPRAPRPPRPTPVRDWWERVRQAVGSDLGVHGLAYLGVLLLFVGVFGLVAFAFGEVTPSLRPVAELAAAVVPFLGARLLLGHGAAVVGRALEVVGGLFLPLMLITSQVDGYGFPPNPTGTGLVVGLAGVCVASALGFAAWSRRHPASGVRFAVAPSLWLAAAMATIGVGREIPSGQDVAVPSSQQTAALAVALAATLLVTRLRPADPLATATRTAAVPGIAVIALLAVLSWSADGAPALPVTVAAMGLLAALELLRPRVPATLADAAGPVWVAAVALTLGGSGVPATVVAAGTAAVSVGLIELAARRGAPAWALGLPAATLLGALLAMWPASWLTTGTLTAVTVWAVARRTRPLPGIAAAFDTLAAVLPLALAAAIGQRTEGWWGLAAAGLLVTVATVPAATDVLRRDPLDRFWTGWWQVAVTAVALGCALPWQVLPTEGRWVALAVLVVLGLLLLVGPVLPTVRPWAVTAVLTTAWLLGCALTDVPTLVRGGAVAGAALVIVVVAGRRRASLALVGHALALVALVTSGPDWGLVLAVGLATAGWVLTALRGERGGSALVAGIEAAGLGYVPWGVVAVGLPTTAALALDRSGVLTGSDPWRVLVPVAVALGYAAVARWVPARRPRVVAAAFAATAALVAVAASGAPWPAVAALAAVPATVVLLPRDLRPEPLGWAAWFAVAPLLGIATSQLWPAFGALPTETAIAVTLTAVSSVLTVAGTAVARDRFRGALGPARGIGVVQLGAALALAVVAVPHPAGARLVVVIAAVLLVIAVQTGVGSLAAMALPLAWGGVVPLAWAGLDDAPWVSVVVVVGLLALAEGLHRLVPGRARWTRWDIPVLVAAAPVAVTALVAAGDGDAYAATFAVVGALTVAVAVRLRTSPAIREVLGAIGSLLILAGAADAGAGWLSLGLVLLAAVHTGIAVRSSGPGRPLRQVVGALAAVAAWAVALDWLAVSSQVAVDASAALAAVVLIGLAVAARVHRPTDRSWHLVWGLTALAVLGTAVLGALVGRSASPTVAVALAVGLVAPAAYVAATPLRAPGLRDLAAALGLGAVLLGLAAADAGDVTWVLVLSVVALVAAGVAVPVAVAGRTTARPLVELGGGAALAALVVALGALPDMSLLVPVVAVCAVQTAAAGVVLRSLGLQVTAPVLACLAWLLAVASPGRAPEWYTVAVGLTLLVIVGIWRRDLRSRGLAQAPSQVVVVEMAGVGFVVVASLVRAVTTSPGHAAVAVGLGVLVAVWGVATRVRRRLAAGVVIVVVAAVLLVAVPLVRLLPSWGGAGGWLVLAGVGLVAVVAASLMERSRTLVRSALGRVGQLTAQWE